jgi:hypothetical protein
LNQDCFVFWLNKQHFYQPFSSHPRRRPMQNGASKKRKIRIKYRDGRSADLTEKQLAAVSKVSGIERLIPDIRTQGKAPGAAAGLCQQKGGEQ